MNSPFYPGCQDWAHKVDCFSVRLPWCLPSWRHEDSSLGGRCPDNAGSGDGELLAGCGAGAPGGPRAGPDGRIPGISRHPERRHRPAEHPAQRRVLGVPAANYDNNQHAENENMLIRYLWEGMETFAALMTMK
jgi:hypothetical protein